MATYTQGCSKVGSFGYAGNFTLYVILNDRDGSSSTNKSFVDYNVYCQSNGSGSINAKHRRFFSINNSTKIDTTGTINASSPNAYISIASGTIEVQHNNDGTKTIPFSAQIQASSYGVSATINGNFELNKIPRYANLTSLSVKSRTINSITLQCTTDKSAQIFCSIDGGNTWLNNGGAFLNNIKSGQFTVKFRNKESTQRLNPNTKYNFTVLCRAMDSGLDTTKAINSTTLDIAKLTSTPNINIGSSHTITWNNPSGSSTSLKLCKTDNSTVINYGTVTGTSKSITPTASTIYALTPNSNKITLRYILTTTYDGQSYTNYRDCVFSVTNSNPTFSNFEYADVNSTTLNLTGNAKTIVKGYSTVRATISTANKAVAKNSATMKKYRLSIGDKVAEKAYSSTANVTLDIAKANSNTFTVYAIDSRENSTSKQIIANKYLSYETIKITSISVSRTNNVGSETSLNFSGYIWNSNFGNVANTIVSCTYRYKKTTSNTWINGTTQLTPTKSGNSFSFRGKIAGDLNASGFDIDESYNVQVLISDKLSNNNSNPASFILGPGSPGIAIDKNNVAVGQRYDTSDSAKFQVNGAANIKGSIRHNGTSIYDLLVSSKSYDNKSSFDEVGSGKDLQHSFMGGVQVNGTWYNLINVRHRNGIGDGPGYGMQIRGEFSKNPTIQTRTQASGSWGNWRTLQQVKSLFDNGSGTNTNITLNETSANFNYIEVFYGDGSNFMSQKIHNPNGKTLYLPFSSFINNRVTFMYQPIKFSGTSVTRGQAYSFNYDSQTLMGADIKIFKILGYH